ncbi:SMC-Scp complex subunit ScpB [Promethearchaeum syntrophicum]|uniref:SMC-Scp complex subunit ScpB n=1 Tax=Promethearchaeum syntrophicum TaxID=2594042 RepID=A0A5B9D7M5_9ARCH|nr:SMC-Scp complex subunit ScpB [Candidatus Prometheoarchaeum syntrophicum]QEE14995.1 segregation and condensation protein B [Candidatus Prometheoarchaeum syntrophicum]
MLEEEHDLNKEINDEIPELDEIEEENSDQQEPDDLDQDEEAEEEDEAPIEEHQIDRIEEPEPKEENIEKDQDVIEQEILADLEEIDKEIESLPAEKELIEEEGEKEEEREEAPENYEELDNNIPGEEITHESIEEFIDEDNPEALETPAVSDELSTEELVSEEIDENSRMKNIIEGALFVAGRPISIEELNIKTEIKKKDLEKNLEELMLDYLMRATALEIVQIQDKFSLQIKPEYTPNVKKFATGGLIPDRHLKTLTIIALKQPILKSKLIKIRGSGAYEHVKFLLDRGFISAMKKGRSYELMTTENFSDTFGLSRDLSTLKKQMINQLGINDTSNNDSPIDDSSNDEE